MTDQENAGRQIDILVEGGQYEEAIALCESLLHRHPRRQLARLKLVYILAGLDRLEDARQQITIAEDLSNKQSAPLYIVKGRLEYYLGDRNFKNSFRRAIELEPKQRQYIYYLAGHEWRGDYLIVNEQKLLYSPVPKSGTTAVKDILARARLLGVANAGEKTTTDILEPPAAGGHSDSLQDAGRNPHLEFNNARFQADRLRIRQLNLGEFYKFAVVRGDVERFESYARSNVMQNGSLLAPSGGQQVYFGLPTQPDMDFLAMNLSKYQFLYLDVIHHTIPERAYLHRERSFYDDVFDLENIASLQRELTNWLGIDMPFERVNSSDKTVQKIALNDRSRAVIQAYYEQCPD